MTDLAILDHPSNRMAGEDGFKDRTILVTGGSGFLGKVFIEKVLRSCPTVKKIYVLIRTKYNKDTQSRLKEIFSNPLYNSVKKLRGEDILKKVVAISGDVGEPGLGISPEDYKLLAEEVEYIYHLAATTRFDEPFKRAVLLNARGTRYMIEFAKSCKHLLLFLHCSTAYCYPHEQILHEKIYPPPADPELVIRMCEEFSDEAIETISKVLMRDCPNTYTYSKALSESLVVREWDNLPINILRPSVVVPIWNDPLPGWTDNMYGPSGLLIAAGKGVLRTMYCNPDGFVDFVPVDIVAGSLILCTWEYMTKKHGIIYNVTSTAEIKFTWQEIIDIGKEITLNTMPLNWVVWCPGGSLKKSKFVHQCCAILFHYIPAIILDAFIILSGNKPVLWRVHKKISGGSELLQYYAHRQWEFNNDQARAARAQLNEIEKKIFKVDKDGFDVYQYFTNATHGARLYLLKEGDETLPTARRHTKVMWFVDKVVKMILLFGFIYLLYKHFFGPLMKM